MYKALRSFVGTISAGKSQIIEIKDKAVAEDLLKAGYIEEIKEEKPKKVVKKTEAEEKKTTKKKK